MSGTSRAEGADRGRADFGFDDESWLERLRSARTATGADGDLGRLDAYELLEQIGRGGQATVYKARQPGTGRLVAIKRVRTTGLDDRGLARFQREIEVAATLRHPGIVTVHELVDDDRGLVMEWIDGPPLDAWADGVRNAPEGLRRIIACVKGACDAVAHAHARGVIHRDLKPSNILVETAGGAPAPRVLDFGLARDATRDDATLTIQGSFAGTPVYAPPEQIDQGLHAADARADVYAMGAVLYRALTGREPFEAPTLAGLFDRIRRGDPEAPSAIMEGGVGAGGRIDAELDAIVLMAMRPAPESRYPTMAALADDLARWLERRAVRAVPTTTTYLVRAFVRRHRVPVALGAAAALLIAGAGVAAGVAALALARERVALKRTIGERDGALTDARVQRTRVQRELAKAESVNMATLLVLERAAAAGGALRDQLANTFGEYAASLGTVPLRPEHEAAMRLHLGNVFRTLGDREREGVQIDLAVRLARERLPDSADLVMALGEAGRLALDAGRNEEAAALLEESRAIARRVYDDAHTMGEAVQNLIEARCRLGQTAEAQRLVDAIPAPPLEFVRRAAASRLAEQCDRLGLVKPGWVVGTLGGTPTP